jgi:hypothetical protein
MALKFTCSNRDTCRTCDINITFGIIEAGKSAACPVTFIMACRSIGVIEYTEAGKSWPNDPVIIADKLLGTSTPKKPWISATKLAGEIA